MMKNSLGQFVRKHQIWSMDNFDDGYVDASGRFKVYLPNHPRSCKNNGYILRSIVAYEFYHNIKLPLFTNKHHIHHIDENTLNDSKENLLLLSISKHRKIHTRLRGCYIQRICNNCKKTFEIQGYKFRDKSGNRGKYCTRKCYKEYRRNNMEGNEK